MFEITERRQSPSLGRICTGCAALGAAIAMGAGALLLAPSAALQGFDGRDDARLFHRGDQVGVFR
ncbi:hypothetical protein ACQ5SO_19280 [Rhodovulum sp. DZ06]|uniref:hypothetical protein n=1 Tax=Rhodovulum sp. DZ06 TaxID=3425126 RepID=UPI003D347A41